jgi:hypothetical protein
MLQYTFRYVPINAEEIIQRPRVTGRFRKHLLIAPEGESDAPQLWTMQSRNNTQSARAKTQRQNKYFRNSGSAFYVGTMTERQASINHLDFLSIESCTIQAVWFDYSWFSAVSPGHDTNIPILTIYDAVAAWTLSRVTEMMKATQHIRLVALLPLWNSEEEITLRHDARSEW